MPLLGPEKEKATEVRVDPALMKLLTSDTRRSLLRKLGSRRMNLTELARDVGLKKATILEHLRRLEEAELVTRSDDHRLWVYYELTPMARSLVDPLGTRIFLVLGVTIAALAVVATMFVFANAQLGVFNPSPEDPGAGTLGVSFHGLHDTYVGHPVDVQGAWQEADPEDGPFTAYLLDDQARAALLVGDPWQPQAVLTVTVDGDSLQVTGSPELDPGDYWLYISDGHGNDNREDMPQIQMRLPPVELSHSEWWRGLDGDVTITLPAGTDMHLQPKDPVPQFAMLAFDENPDDQGIAIANETVRLSTGMLDNKTAGTYEIHYRPPGSDRWMALNETLTVRDVTLSVVPHALVEGLDREVTILLSSSGGARPDEVPVKINGENMAIDRLSPGRAAVRVDDLEPGELRVQVGRLVNQSVQVMPDLDVEIALQDGPETIFRVHDAQGQPENGVEIRLDEERLGVTDTRGRLRIAPPLAQGDGRLVFTTPGGHEVAWRVMVTGWDLLVRSHQVQLGSIDSDHGTLRVDVENPDEWPVNATLVGTQEGGLYAATAFRLEGHERRGVELPPVEPRLVDSGYRVQAEGPPLKTPVFKNETDDGDGASDPGAGGAPPPREEPGSDPEPVFGSFISTARDVFLSSTEQDMETQEPGEADHSDGLSDSDAAQAEGEDSPAVPLLGVLLVTLLGLLLGRRGGRPGRGEPE